MKGKMGDYAVSYLFIFPAMLGLTIFILIPTFYTLYLSFLKASMLNPLREYTGWENYLELFFQDKLFWRSLLNVGYYAILLIPLRTALSLGLALIVHQKIKGVGFFRIVYFLPVMISMVIVAVMWRLVYNVNTGLLNGLLGVLRLPTQPFLTSSGQAMPSIVVMSIWQSVGYFMIIYLAGLYAIPNELYEAAELDGANEWKKLIYLTLPSLNRVTLFIIVISTMWSLKVFTPIYLMTYGGPRDSTVTAIYHVYMTVFTFSRLGYGCTMSVILFIIILILTLVEIKLIGERTQY